MDMNSIVPYVSVQFTLGCGNESCTNPQCKSSKAFAHDFSRAADKREIVEKALKVTKSVGYAALCFPSVQFILLRWLVAYETVPNTTQPSLDHRIWHVSPAKHAHTLSLTETDVAHIAYLDIRTAINLQTLGDIIRFSIHDFDSLGRFLLSGADFAASVALNRVFFDKLLAMETDIATAAAGAAAKTAATGAGASPPTVAPPAGPPAEPSAEAAAQPPVVLNNAISEIFRSFDATISDISTIFEVDHSFFAGDAHLQTMLALLCLPERLFERMPALIHSICKIVFLLSPALKLDLRTFLKGFFETPNAQGVPHGYELMQKLVASCQQYLTCEMQLLARPREKVEIRHLVKNKGSFLCVLEFLETLHYINFEGAYPDDVFLPSMLVTGPAAGSAAAVRARIHDDLGDTAPAINTKFLTEDAFHNSFVNAPGYNITPDTTYWLRSFAKLHVAPPPPAPAPAAGASGAPSAPEAAGAPADAGTPDAGGTTGSTAGSTAGSDAASPGAPAGDAPEPGTAYRSALEGTKFNNLSLSELDVSESDHNDLGGGGGGLALGAGGGGVFIINASDDPRMVLSGNPQDLLRAFFSGLPLGRGSAGLRAAQAASTPDGMFSMLQFPFLLSPTVKAAIFRFEVVERRLFNPMERIFINRGDVFNDTLNYVVSHSDLDAPDGWRSVRHRAFLRRPLNVVFDREEGIDAGGLRKEFFSLLSREMIRKCVLGGRLPLFKYNEVSKTYYLNDAVVHYLGALGPDGRPDPQLVGPAYDLPAALDDAERFLVFAGMCIALILLNEVTVDSHLPHVLYKKLLGFRGSFHDLRCYDPYIYKGLYDLHAFATGDATKGLSVEDAFCLTFSVAREVPDLSEGALDNKTVIVDLIPDGRRVPVTNDNYCAYIRALTDYELNLSVQPVFNWVLEGFMLIAKSKSLTLFTPCDLEQALCGEQVLDFAALRAVTKYQAPFSEKHEVVCWFWDIVLTDFTDANKVGFMKFVFGNSRAPVGGLGNVDFQIHQNGDDDAFLPMAHTCFGILMLPRYSSREALRRKLLQAIENNEGFGLK